VENATTTRSRGKGALGRHDVPARSPSNSSEFLREQAGARPACRVSLVAGNAEHLDHPNDDNSSALPSSRRSGAISHRKGTLMKRLSFARRITAALALVLATSAFAVLAPAAHADPNPNLVVTGSTLYLVYKDADGPGKMTIDVIAKNAGIDDVDVTIEQNGVAVSGEGTLTEYPNYFKLECELYDGYGGEYYFTGKIYRGSGQGYGKYQEYGTSFWNKWYTLGFYD
jgi:hypothetical protein